MVRMASIACGAIFVGVAAASNGSETATQSAGAKAATVETVVVAENEAVKLEAATPAEAKKEEAPAKTDEAKQIERGNYLTHHVAMCVVCHSPKDKNGKPVAEKEFQGDSIPVHPEGDPNAWARRAPALGPLASGASEEVIQLLKTGIWPRSGEPPLPPMPQFKLTDEDARAVVAYLKSLGGKSK